MYIHVKLQELALMLATDKHKVYLSSFEEAVRAFGNNL